MQIAHEILSNTKAKKCLKMSLVAAVRSIRAEWDLSVEELSQTLQLHDSVVRTWFRRQGSPEVSSLRDQDTQALLDFMDVYEVVSSRYESKVTQREWLRTSTSEWGGLSPLEFMQRNRASLVAVKARFQSLLQ